MLRSSSKNLLRVLAALAVSTAAACGVDDVARVDVAVQPRVVLDGTLELSDRTAGRVVIDEVIAHAPEAVLRAAVAGDEGDTVVNETNPLLFRYALADRTGFGAALSADGVDRVWSVPVSGAALDVAFGKADHNIADAYDADSDVLDGLGGHTLILHGTLAVDTDVEAFSSGFGDASDVDPDGGAADCLDCDVDPDGGAADGADTSDVDPDGGAAKPASDTSDVDPDGGAAQPSDPAGGVSDVDPDGGAAHPVNGDVSDVDPDGGAAHPGNGNASDVDPDGGAADGTDGNGSGAKTPSKAKQARGQTRRATVNVPFSLVVDGDFDLEVVLDANDVVGVGDGELMPIDLHLSTAELLDDARIIGLEAIAKSALAKNVEATVTMPVSGAATVAATDVRVPRSIKRPRTVTDNSSRIRVSGDLRK